MKTRLSLMPFPFFALAGCTFTDATNDIYLIPEGYEGNIYAFYNVKGAPAVEEEGDYQVHEINGEGYFATSTPGMDYGTVTDKYFYVDGHGQRTAIKQECIEAFGTGGFETNMGSSNAINIPYTGFNVKKEGCGEEVAESRDELDSADLEAALSKITEKYYGFE